MQKSVFELLRNKDILSILDGDTSFGSLEIQGTDKKISISLPYLSGPMLCNISNKFGLPVTYDWHGETYSRWMYLDNLLKHCIQQNRVSDLLSFLFSKDQFSSVLNGLSPKSIESAYSQIIHTVIEHINGALYFGGHELIRSGNIFIIQQLNPTISIAIPTIKTIDHSYIADLSNRALIDVAERNYDSAITKSRTLLEEVFCYAIEKKGQEPSENGDINKLYNQVKQLYNMHQSKEQDKRINSLLSGLEKILSAIAEMRNKSSDAHGVGGKRISIAEHHARLFVNSALTMADFILAVAINSTSTS